ncbi:MAG: twitching motility protein PilT [Eubacteriaceae bacterium]|nr:twitching motility protein PilT [Eubacteriaceae bacterium]
MITIITGPQGSGKTQKLIDMANSELDNTKGLIVYIDHSNNHRLAVNSRIRFINTEEFAVGSKETFSGFLCGLVAGNYDINRLFIDNIVKIIDTTDAEALRYTLNEIEKLCQMNDMQCFLALNSRSLEGLDTEGMEIVTCG